jgi:hypothetical protein
MSVFCSVGGDQYRFRLDHPLVAADNPPSDKESVAGGDVPAKSNPEFGGERFCSSSGHGFRHRFIENRADNASMNDSVKAFPDGRWSPGCGYSAIVLSLKSYL